MYLYIDLNSFFASCEQQDRPELRGKPVAVVPMLTDSTCAIAASYQAKKFGIRTGTNVRIAKEMCPGIILVPARQKLYVEYHHKVMDAIRKCIPVQEEQIESIDEVSCRLMANESSPEASRTLSLRIKEVLRQEVGECITCSIGVAPNKLLAKVAADMHKPDGLTIIMPEDLPVKIYPLVPQDIPGIGYRMVKRLSRFGIYDMKGLWTATPQQLKAIWGGVGGLRFYAKLHGEDIADIVTKPSVIGHSQVLDPIKRNYKSALEVLKMLAEKAAERLRNKGFYASRISIDVKLANKEGYLFHEMHFSESQHTSDFLKYVEQMWEEIAPQNPMKVGVNLHGLVDAHHHQLDMFTPVKNYELLKAVDTLNKKYGRGTVGFGHQEERTLTKDKIAFQRVPKLYEM